MRAKASSRSASSRLATCPTGAKSDYEFLQNSSAFHWTSWIDLGSSSTCEEVRCRRTPTSRQSERTRVSDHRLELVWAIVTRRPLRVSRRRKCQGNTARALAPRRVHRVRERVHEPARSHSCHQVRAAVGAHGPLSPHQRRRHALAERARSTGRSALPSPTCCRGRLCRARSHAQTGTAHRAVHPLRRRRQLRAMVRQRHPAL